MKRIMIDLPDDVDALGLSVGHLHIAEGEQVISQSEEIAFLVKNGEHLRYDGTGWIKKGCKV